MIISISNIDKREDKINITLGDDCVCLAVHYTDLINCENGVQKQASKLVVGDKICFSLYNGEDSSKVPTAEDYQKIERLFSSKRRFYDKPLSNFVLYN